MKLRPLHDNVLVKRTEEEETSSGGIILSGSAKEKPSQGEVVAVGPGKLTKSGDLTTMNVSVGEEVKTARCFLRGPESLPPNFNPCSYPPPGGIYRTPAAGKFAIDRAQSEGHFTDVTHVLADWPDRRHHQYT